MPPNMKELRTRLIERGFNDEDDLDRRLRIAETEMLKSHFYNHKVIMDNFDKEIENVCDYILTEIAKLNSSKK
jgi:guanylate kinase